MQTTDTPDIRLPRPTRARFVALGFLCSMAFVLYLDRLCIQQALDPMREEFGLSYEQMSYVLMAFTLAYGLFEIPTGRWGDRFGSRGVLTRIVLWWSAFTALTGCVPFIDSYILTVPATLLLLIAIRFLFGAGEAGAIPNGARILMNWFSSAERGSMQGWFQASMHVGGAIAPLIAAGIIESPLGWRGSFIAFGGVGLIWASFFYWWFRDKPSEHPGVNQAELQVIDPHEENRGGHAHAIPWAEALTHPNVWLLAIITMTSAYNSYFFFSWYSSYLRNARAVDNIEAGRLSALALAGATCGSLLGGLLADWIARHATDRYRVRRLLCLAAYLSSAGFLLASIHVDTPWISAAFCALACLMLFCQLPTWWACSFDVSGKHTGAMFGLLNGAGVVGAMGSQYFFGAFVDWRIARGFEGRERWDPAFYSSIVLLFVGGLLWQFIYPRRAIGELPPPPTDRSGDDQLKTAIQAAPPDGAIREGPVPPPGERR